MPSSLHCSGDDRLSLSMIEMRRCPSCLLFYTNSARPSKSGPSTNPRKPLPRWTRISFFVLKLLLLSAKSARSCLKGLSLSFVSSEYLKFSIHWHKHRICSADVELRRACCWVGWEVHKSSTKGRTNQSTLSPFKSWSLNGSFTRETWL
jgi:hypothetical protein